MKCFKSQIKSALLPIALLSMSGCASYNPQVTDNAYTFNSKPNYGLVAFSMTCNGDWGTISMPLYEDNKSFSKAMASPQLDTVQVPCDGQKQYVLLSLEKGAYYILGITPINETVSSTQVINFNATQQRVNYLGAFYVTAKHQKNSFLTKMFVNDSNGTMEMGLNNEFQKDIPVFRNHYQNIPASSYRFEKVTTKSI